MPMPTPSRLAPASPRQPVSVSSHASGPSADSGTCSIITYGIAVACMSQVWARMRPVGVSAQITEQPPSPASGAGFHCAWSGDRSRRSV